MTHSDFEKILKKKAVHYKASASANLFANIKVASGVGKAGVVKTIAAKAVYSTGAKIGAAVIGVAGSGYAVHEIIETPQETQEQHQEVTPINNSADYKLQDEDFALIRDSIQEKEDAILITEDEKGEESNLIHEEKTDEVSFEDNHEDIILPKQENEDTEQTTQADEILEETFSVVNEADEINDDSKEDAIKTSLDPFEVDKTESSVVAENIVSDKKQDATLDEEFSQEFHVQEEVEPTETIRIDNNFIISKSFLSLGGTPEFLRKSSILGQSTATSSKGKERTRNNRFLLIPSVSYANHSLSKNLEQGSGLVQKDFGSSYGGGLAIHYKLRAKSDLGIGISYDRLTSRSEYYSADSKDGEIKRSYELLSAKVLYRYAFLQKGKYSFRLLPEAALLYKYKQENIVSGKYFENTLRFEPDTKTFGYRVGAGASAGYQLYSRLQISLGIGVYWVDLGTRDFLQAGSQLMFVYTL